MTTKKFGGIQASNLWHERYGYYLTFILLMFVFFYKLLTKIIFIFGNTLNRNPSHTHGICACLCVCVHSFKIKSFLPINI